VHYIRIIGGQEPPSRRSAMNRKFPYTAELTAFQNADDAWSEELIRIHGKEACHARYGMAGRGQSGTKLHALHEAREQARIKWHQSADPKGI
jgi:hypothetical protein